MNVSELKEVLGECASCTIGGRKYDSAHKVPRFYDRSQIMSIDIVGTDHIVITLEGDEEDE